VSRSNSDHAAADLIASLRNQSGLTQAELSRRTGIQRSVLSAYEHGRRQPSVGALARLAEAAGYELQLVLASDQAAVEHAGKVLAQVLDLAEQLPFRPRSELAYPPLARLAA
jgi:hypothetical protein